MHLCKIEALAVGQDGSGPGSIAKGQLPGGVAYSHSRPLPVIHDSRQRGSEIFVSPVHKLMLSWRIHRSGAGITPGGSESSGLAVPPAAILSTCV